MMNNLKPLQEEIAELNAFNLQIQDAVKLDLKLMRQATEQASEILRNVNVLLAWKAYDNDLDEMMRAVLVAITQLHKVADGHAKNPPTPSKIMLQVTGQFEKFFDMIMAREKRNKLHDLILAAPYIGKVIHFCEFVPSCWSYCNKAEKMAIVLSATLAITAIAMLIAVQFTPAIAALPIIMPAMNALLSLSAALYTKVTADALVRHDNQKEVHAIKNDLQAQKVFMEAKFIELNPKDATTKLTKKASLTYSDPKRDSKKNPKNDKKLLRSHGSRLLIKNPAKHVSKTPKER